MKELELKLGKSVNYNPVARASWDKAVAHLKNTPLQWNEGRLTQDAIFAALCLWLDDLARDSPDRLVAIVGHYLDVLRARTLGESEPSLATFEVEELPPSGPGSVSGGGGQDKPQPRRRAKG